MKLFRFLTVGVAVFFTAAPISDNFRTEIALVKPIADRVQKDYFRIRPSLWGENIYNAKNKIYTKSKIAALTLDACGGKNGSDYDAALIDFLIANNIKATLFINARWIKINYDIFVMLSKNPLFEIANHGLEHRPLSVNSREIYNISGTGSPSKVAYEVEANGILIESITGVKPKFFRSGTAYYDDIGVKITEELGYSVAGFSVNADKGATLPADEVAKRVSKTAPGDIIIAHMNRPHSGTRQGLSESLPELIKNGFKFIKLSEMPLVGK